MSSASTIGTKRRYRWTSIQEPKRPPGWLRVVWWASIPINRSDGQYSNQTCPLGQGKGGSKEKVQSISECLCQRICRQEIQSEGRGMATKFGPEKKQGLKGWFGRNGGKGWVDCKTGKACGRKSAKGGSKRPYPACRPTKAMCKAAPAKRKNSSKRVSWKKS